MEHLANLFPQVLYAIIIIKENFKQISNPLYGFGMLPFAGKIC